MRTWTTALLVAALGTQAGCFGSFKLTQKVYQFNDEVSDSIVVKEILFLVMVIVPVYGIATFADAIILNLIEFITGSNPIADASSLLEVEGAQVSFERVKGGIEVVVDADGEQTRHTFKRYHGTWEVVDAAGQRVALLEKGPDGSLVVVDGAGEPLASYSARDVDYLTASVYTGGWSGMVAAMRVTTGSMVAAR